MRGSVSLLSTVLLIGGAVFSCHGQSVTCDTLDASLVAHSGEPVGREVKHENITIYISEPDSESPRTQARVGAAVLFLTDVFGLALPENKLLADSFARAGYLTVMPDLFSGSPAPGDINVPGFNTSAFLAAHTPAVTDPIISAAAAYARTQLNATRLAAPGYCFGGRYAFRAVAARSDSGGGGGVEGVDVAYAAHPSLLQADEIAAVDGPVAIAAAEVDALFNATARVAAEEGLRGAGEEPYRVVLYSGTGHGFAVRIDVGDEEQRWAKEEAFLQAVRWFDRFLVE